MNGTVKTGFTSEELQLGYPAWKLLSDSRRSNLSHDVRRWLSLWTMWDLACSPMDDKARAQIRYGHYLGYYAAIQDIL